MYDQRNKLNDLCNDEWMRLTKSVWTPELLESRLLTDPHVASQHDERFANSVLWSHPRKKDSLKQQHPATFAEADIRKLILLFTKKGQVVLDPFLGVGSTAIACLQTQRSCIGIELYSRWFRVCLKRISLATRENTKRDAEISLRIIRADARRALEHFAPENCDFMVTSPPYWSILRKRADKKTKATRLAYGLATSYGNKKMDLSLIDDYDKFLSEIGLVLSMCFRVLRGRSYAAIIVGDFRSGGRYYDFHADITRKATESGFILQGITILVHSSRHLYPYGLPFSYVSNIQHDYVLIFRKP